MVAYEFSDDDRLAFEHGIESTDEERDIWFDYLFNGRSELRIKVALDPGSSMVFIGVEPPQALDAKIGMLLEIGQEFFPKEG